MCTGGVCPVRRHRAWGQPALFGYEVQVGRGQVVPVKAEGLHVEREVCQLCLAERQKGWN